ncbi:MAG: M14 family zinc carboxypeptidase [Bdellovibrionota bacterium]
MNLKPLELGRSVQGKPLNAFYFEGRRFSGRPLVLLGGVHGDEIEGVWLMEELLSTWSSTPPSLEMDVLIWPRVNPDGVEAGARWNARNVDLNRNLPTKDWTPEMKNPRYPPGPHAASEPENKALVSLIERHQPRAILSAHSFSKYQVNSNGPAREWAEALARVSGYPVTEDIGYPTPGALGTYAGKEKLIPTITLEIERGLDRERVLELHVPVVEAAIAYWENKEMN